jgi:DNA helicase IV
MELAWHVLGEQPLMKVPREGNPVKVIRTHTWQETADHGREILHTYIKSHPRSLVGVICRYKAEADHIFDYFKRFDFPSLRRHQRDDFSFQPGVIVTNAHQVKGLEFSAVLVVNPDLDQYRDDKENRMLLHMVMTRAADQLWIIGHQPMAYGIEKWNA